ncbi:MULTISPECIES: DUF904 domain-containing protein [unclassified Oceanobacter]|jgi:cell division protein ZapB|uniref:DUF904 domain-containing protein n=1 Tax=unclassified Oceanobacter TaxID=2620260 RepID=UPI0026E36B8E|nr:MULTISPECIES: DUF904 domain-containing protein [unclassified Oceanobacter]MDO6680793.1 DUF904 domain-containing protein [Oceanobacter sp. 5_MG-2023]MDP2546985.1 DUF904 domain-containing protein [Oceanobacter sp. 4_MG-2023]MDP2607809.1 DUF904 domain-containing protein [Oceanobacter sp. 1_MG-2023]MDP2611007.1 DUF904 domain-containing protein [Oceanobacter sp. 2_MG-2023]
MPANDLHSLQQRILKLLDIHQELYEENQRMRAEEANWQSERTRLVQQNEAARRKVHEMIQKLQVLERNCGQ